MGASCLSVVGSLRLRTLAPRQTVRRPPHGRPLHPPSTFTLHSAAPMASPVERLPVELADMVVAHLPLDDYQNLRLASRQLSINTVSTFRSRFFTKRTTTLSVPSLGRLVNISSCPPLARLVSLLDVKLHNYGEYMLLQEISRVGIYPPPKRFSKVSRVRTEDINQEAQLYEYMKDGSNANSVLQPLVRVLRACPNIRTVRFRVNRTTVDEGRLEIPEFDVFAIHCFRALMMAIVAGGTTLDRLLLTKSAKVRVSTKCADLLYPAFDFPGTDLLALRSPFASLKCLNLSLRACSFFGSSRVPGTQDCVSRFIGAAPALEELAICFGLRKSAFKSTIMASICRSVELSRLRDVQLYNAALCAEDFIFFTKVHSATLRSLSISFTQLQGFWIDVLNSLRESNNLEYLRLSSVQEKGPPQAYPRLRLLTWKGRAKPSEIITMDPTRNRLSMEDMLGDAVNFLLDQAHQPV